MASLSDVQIGMRLVVKTLNGEKKKGIIRFIGETDFATGTFLGLEMDEPVGNHNGSWQGSNYYKCKPHHGIFCWPPGSDKQAKPKARKKREDGKVVDVGGPLPVMTQHFKARLQERYERTPVPDDKVPWDVDWPEYAPREHTEQVVLKNDRSVKVGGWADPVEYYRDPEFKGRHSFHVWRYGQDDRPLNPVGRTGLCGRGLLGKWGPNQAADPLVFRIDPANGKLQIILIKRADNGNWAIPGGMVDDGEVFSVTLKREFGEEAATFENPDDRKLLDEIFEEGEHQRLVYAGYVDDPRNTDNSWMETNAIAFMLTQQQGDLLQLEVTEGETNDVQWKNVLFLPIFFF
jgi:ADP-ribose pyrophosphatase